MARKRANDLAAHRTAGRRRADGALDSSHDPAPVGGRRRLGGDPRRVGRGDVRFERSAHESVLAAGTDTERAENVLEEHFGQKTTGSFSLIVGESLAQRVLSFPRHGGRRRGQLERCRPPRSPPSRRSPTTSSRRQSSPTWSLRTRRGTPTTCGGRSVGSRAPRSTSADKRRSSTISTRCFADDIFVGEVLIAIPVALLILVFVFGTLAFVIPLLFAAVAIPSTLGIIWIFANFLELSTYLQNLVMLIGLGVAVDYSLLIVYRYREELRAGRSADDAIARTMATAGRAVVFSGTAVAIGLAVLFFMPLPFMRGFGFGLFIPVVSVVCALTLLPVLLHLLGAKLDRVHLVPARVVERRDAEDNFWWRLSRTIMRRPVLFATGATALLLALAIPLFSLELGPGTNKGIPRTWRASRA